MKRSYPSLQPNLLQSASKCRKTYCFLVPYFKIFPSYHVTGPFYKLTSPALDQPLPPPPLKISCGRACLYLKTTTGGLEYFILNERPNTIQEGPAIYMMAWLVMLCGKSRKRPVSPATRSGIAMCPWESTSWKICFRICARKLIWLPFIPLTPSELLQLHPSNNPESCRFGKPTSEECDGPRKWQIHWIV